jgi:hypothetical protein
MATITNTPQRELHDYISDFAAHADVRAGPALSAILLAGQTTGHNLQALPGAK